MDGTVLSGDGPIDQIPDRNNADDPARVEHSEVPDTMGRHQSHAFLHTVTRRDMDYFPNDLPYGCLLGRFAFESDLAGIITLGQDAHQFVLFGYQQRTNIFIRHHLNRLKNSQIGSDRPDSCTLLVEQFVNRTHRIHRSDADFPREPRRNQPGRTESASRQASWRLVVAAGMPQQA